MKIKTIKHTYNTEEIESEVEMINKYFRLSHSVYAVEFKKNIYNKDACGGDIWHSVTFIRVKFEVNIILSKTINFCDKHPLSTNSLHEDWVKDLFQAYTTEHYYDNITKEQFDVDFNNTINNLSSLRN